MKRSLIVAAIVAAAVAAGCGTTAPTSPEQAVFAAKTIYATTLTAAVAYKRLPTCSDAVKVPCKEPALVAQLQKADNVAAASLDAAEAAARTPRVGATATARAVEAAQASLDALTSLVATLGVKQ